MDKYIKLLLGYNNIMDLKCRKQACKYNNYFTCTARNISITNKLACEVFENDPSKNIRDTSRCMFDEAPKYAPHRAKKHMRVTCAAKCLFNEQGICIANGLTVNSINENPLCITYIRP